MTSPSTSVSSLSSGSPSSVMSAKCRARPSRTASVRFGSSDVMISIPSASSLITGLTWVRLHLCRKFRTCRSTPSLGSILPSVYENGFSSHKCPLWFLSSTVSCCRHSSAVDGNVACKGSRKWSSSKLDGSRLCCTKTC